MKKSSPTDDTDPAQSRDYNPYIRQIAGLDDPKSAEVFARILLVFVAVITTAIVLDMGVLLIWYAVYVSVLLADQALSEASRSQSSLRWYIAQLSLVVLQSFVVAFLAILLWQGESPLHAFAALLTVTAAMIRSLLLRSLNIALLICDAVPIVAALLLMAASMLEQSGDPEKAIAAVIMALCLSSYFFVAVWQHAVKRRTYDKSQQVLFQAQKIKALGALTGGVAHDFNNLLTVTMGNLELYEQTESEEERKQLVQDAYDAAHRGSQLTRHLLSYARRAPLLESHTQIGDAIEDLRKLLVPTLPASIALELQVAPDLPKIMIDPCQLQSALLNLAINARDAMPKGGRLTISGLLADEGTRTVVFQVADTGTGMTPAQIEQAKEPFFSTKPYETGSGLGLSSVTGFVEQSRGKLEIRSKPGKGTTVRLLFSGLSQS
ncbi:MAG: two-component system cell cycle sensor histidine kinase/response regulator CckA [Paracoccaceae bacterium]|jgi:signal transduction histidine kinase